MNRFLFKKALKDKNKIIKLTLFLVLFCFLTIIKLHGFDRVPSPNHAEELLYSWSGIHLIETGVPVSWSTLDYPKENLVFDGIVGNPKGLFLPAKLYRPWLDEPPLYSLMSGGIAHLYGDDRNMVIPTSHSRVPSVLASLVTMFLVFYTGYMFFDYKTGILSMLFYGLTPIFAFGSRLSVPENITACFSMVSLILIKRYINKPKIIYSIVFGIETLLLGLMKPTGFFLAPLLMFFMIQKKRWGDVAIVVGFVTIGILLFILYGNYYGWEIFKHIVSIQGGRFAGWSGLGFILSSPAFDIFNLYDGWYIFSLIFSLFFIFKNKKQTEYKLLSIFFLYWIFIVVFSGSEQDLLPWYRYPLYPLMSIFGALGLIYVYKKINFFTLAFTVGLLLSTRFYLVNAFRPGTPTIVFRIVCLFSLIPALIHLAWKPKWTVGVMKFILIIFVILGLYFNSKYIYSAFEINCENKVCPFGSQTILSKAKMPIFWRWLTLGSSEGMLTDKRPWF